MHHIGDFQSLLVAYGAFTIISLSIMSAINEYGRGTRFTFTRHVNFSVKFQSRRSMPYFFFCFCQPAYRVSISNNLNENLTSHATSKKHGHTLSFAELASSIILQGAKIPYLVSLSASRYIWYITL